MIRTVGIRDLKNNLSAWLREVKAGARVLVTQHGSVVAELRPPPAGDPWLSAPSALDEWVREGRVLLPRAAREPMPESTVRKAPGTACELLDLGRDQS